MISVTISGDNPAEFSDRFAFYAQRFGYVPREQAFEIARQAVMKAAGGSPAKPAEQTVEATAETLAEPEATKPIEGEVLPPEKPRGRGRPKAVEKPIEATPEPAPEPAPEKPAEQKPLTTDDVRIAMKELAARVNVEAVSKLLGEFGVAKASEVPADKIAKFVEMAKASNG